MYKTLHKKQGSVTVQLRFARSSVTFCAKRDIAAGDHVKKGDLLLDADLEKIQEAGLHIITPVLVCNTDEYNKISILKEGEVSPGEDVLQIS